MDTLKQAFLGKKELFEGLYLYDNWDWDKVHPVIHIDFGLRSTTSENIDYLKNFIYDHLKLNAKYLNLECNEKDCASCFEHLIINAYEKYNQKVVVLIDEYDKPILDNINQKEKAKEIREVLKNLYSVLKPMDSYLHLWYIAS